MALTDKNMIAAAYALKQIGMHIGMYGRFRKEIELTESQKYECLGCVAIIQNQDTHFIQKMACSLILDYYLPEWRDIVGKELIGHIVERNDNEVRLWRKRVLQRDDHKCTECGTTENLEAHHIAHWAEFPELRLIDDNGTTLCNGCHAKQHENIANLILSRVG